MRIWGMVVIKFKKIHFSTEMRKHLSLLFLMEDVATFTIMFSSLAYAGNATFNISEY